MKKINVGIANLFVSNQLKESYFNGSELNETKKVAKSLLEIIKESPILQLEFKIFNNIENKHIENDVLATRYIDNNIKLFETYTIDELENEHKKLIKFIKEDQISDNNKVKLYESVFNLIEESLKTYDEVDVDKIHESFNVVLEHIKKDKTKNNIIESENINEDIIELAINRFNEKYSNLDEQDIDLFKKLVSYSDDEKLKLFEDFKINNISLIESLDLEEDKKIKTIKKINEMVFDITEIDNNIIKLHELKKELI
jgi:hypothetical protein